MGDLADVSDLFEQDLIERDLCRRLERIFDGVSQVHVYKIINLVFLVRAFVDDGGRGPAEFRGRQQRLDLGL